MRLVARSRLDAPERSWPRVGYRHGNQRNLA
jgi:hypothetical protein